MNRAHLSLPRRIIRYGFAGVLATLIYAASVIGFVELAGLTAVQAAVAATLVVMVTSYLINRAWVFETNRGHLSAVIRFGIATGLSIGLNAGLMAIAVHAWAWPYLAGLILTTLVVPPVNFVLNYLWAFRQGPRANGL